MDGAAQATAPLSGGKASYATSSLSVGPHAVAASYGGDGSNAASTSSALTQTVNAPAATPKTHLLWSNTDHRAMFWNVNPDGSFTVAAGYGPYTDGSPSALWTATALATGPDGVSHILWNNADHRVMLWNVNNDGSFTVIGGYGPYTDGAASNTGAPRACRSAPTT